MEIIAWNLHLPMSPASPEIANIASATDLDREKQILRTAEPADQCVNYRVGTFVRVPEQF